MSGVRGKKMNGGGVVEREKRGELSRTTRSYQIELKFTFFVFKVYILDNTNKSNYKNSFWFIFGEIQIKINHKIIYFFKSMVYSVGRLVLQFSSSKPKTDRIM